MTPLETLEDIESCFKKAKLMGEKLLVTLNPQRYHDMIALRNSEIFDNYDVVFRKTHMLNEEWIEIRYFN